MVDEWLHSDRGRIIDRSGWLNHGRHQFVLMERQPYPGEAEADTGPIRFVAVVQVEQWQGEQLAYRIDDESVGPLQEDCPMRIMRQLEDSPPVNEFSRGWRERVVFHHPAMGPRRAVLRKLRKEHPLGGQKVVLTDSRQVKYLQGSYRGRRNCSAYWDPEQRQATLLRPQMVDAGATRELWKAEAEKKGQQANPQPARAASASRGETPRG